jgi:hypothetical protein
MPFSFRSLFKHRRRAMRFLQLGEKITDPVRRSKAIDLAIRWAVRAKGSGAGEAASTTGRPLASVAAQQQQQAD